MTKLRRFGVSIEKGLLREFDEWIKSKRYANRSDALRVLMRSFLLEVQTQEDPDMEVIGTITLVYDHTSGDLTTRLTDIQHRYHQFIVSTLHIHFDELNCLEVIAVRGPQKGVRAIADSLIGTRGLRQGKLIINAGLKADRRHTSPHRHPGLENLRLPSDFNK